MSVWKRTIPPLPGCRNCDQYTRTGLQRKETQVILQAVSSGVRADIRNHSKRLLEPKRSMVIETSRLGKSSAKEYKYDDEDFKTRSSNTYGGHLSDTIPLTRVSKGTIADTKLLKVNVPSDTYSKKYKDREYAFNEQKNKLIGHNLLSVSKPSMDPTLGMQNIPDNNKFSDKGQIYEGNRVAGVPMTYDFYTNKKLLKVTT